MLYFVFKDMLILPKRLLTRLKFPIPITLMSISGILLLVQLFVGASNIGISTDSPIHVRRTISWFQNGYYLPSTLMKNGQPKSDQVVGRIHAYGPAFGISAHLFNVLFNNEPFALPLKTQEAHEGRHLFTALLSLLASFALGFLMWKTTSSLFFGLFAGLSLTAIPAWLGYSMMLPKDIPAAVGFSLLTTALSLTIIAPPTRFARHITFAFAFLGMFYALGVRIAFWVPLACSIVAFFVLNHLCPHNKEQRSYRKFLLAGFISGFFLVCFINYRSLSHPFDWLIGSVLLSADFTIRSAGETLTAGLYLPYKSPDWWYLPAWIGTALPLGILSLSILGIILTLNHFFISRFRANTLNPLFAVGVLFLIQALFLPTVAIINGSVIYGGLRQHVYTIPGFCALATIAAFWLFNIVKNKLSNFYPLFLALAVLVPAIEQVQLWPFNYIYRSVLAGPLNNRWELDLHRVSYREALRNFPHGFEISCLQGGKISQCKRVNIFIKSFLEEQGRNTTNLPPIKEGYAPIIRQNVGKTTLPPFCYEYNTVTRKLRGETLNIIYVLACPQNHIF